MRTRSGGGTSFDPVRSTRVLQVHRSLGSDHSLNTPRCTCRGIIHCLYFPLPPAPPSPSPPVASLLDLVSSSLAPALLPFFFSSSSSYSFFFFIPFHALLTEGNSPQQRALLGSPPSAPCSFISHYRDPSVYPSSHPRSRLVFGTPSLRTIAYYAPFLGAREREREILFSNRWIDLPEKELEFTPVRFP